MGMVQREEADSRRENPSSSSSSLKIPSHKASRVSAEEAGHSSTNNLLKIFSEIDRLAATKPVLEYKPLSLQVIRVTWSRPHWYYFFGDIFMIYFDNGGR